LLINQDRDDQEGIRVESTNRRLLSREKSEESPTVRSKSKSKSKSKSDSLLIPMVGNNEIVQLIKMMERLQTRI